MMGKNKYGIFFGYGALKDKNVLKEIIGHYPEFVGGGLITNFDLAYQRLNQIPEKPREILRKVWGDTFKAYTITEGKGIVVGSIYEISYDDFLMIENWEFVKEWREFIEVKITMFNGHRIKAYTTKVSGSQKIEKYIDGIDYETSLNPQGKKQLYESQDKIAEIEMIRKQIKIMKKH